MFDNNWNLSNKSIFSREVKFKPLANELKFTQT